MNKVSVWKRAFVLFVICAGTAVALPAQTTTIAPAVTFRVLHSFDLADGNSPIGELVQGTGGKLYGMTQSSGANNYGTVFTITPGGTLTTIYTFCLQNNCPDGNTPSAGLVQGTDGNFYGATVFGGANNEGTVFKITPNGVLTTLHSFDKADGEYPEAGLMVANDGNLYGTTNEGGGHGDGTIFKITPGGTLTTLHKFTGPDGAFSTAALVQGSDGNFYGTTHSGGDYGYGTVFRITPSGILTTLYRFDVTDGARPLGALVQGIDGNFYGTTWQGGANCTLDGGCGTVFKITPGGTLTTIYSFCEQVIKVNCTDGDAPFAGLVQGTDGNFYGTTFEGGTRSGFGTLFMITPSGTLTTLYSFCPRNGHCTDGESPIYGLVQDTNGTLYGTSEGGGLGYGTVYSLSVGLGPFVKTNPVSADVGTAVTILGTNLTGATSVTFNGTPATFTVKLRSEITTTVPTGATTGTVQVVTPGGTLSSNVSFRVLP